MAGSHEVRGSIPLGSTTDPRGARRRRRAPLFVSWAPARRAPAPGSRAYGTDGPMGRKARPIRGRRRGPAPLSRSPGFAGPIWAPGRKARPRRPRASRGRGARSRPRRARGGRAGPARAHRGDPQQGGDAFGAWPPRPRRVRRGRLARGKQPPEGGAKAADGIGADSAAASSRTPTSTACRRRSMPGGPSPARATRATTRPSSPPTGPRRRSSPIGGRPPTSAGSAASPTHASGGAAGRGRIRRWAAWAPRSPGMRDCPRGKCLAGRRESAVGSDAPSHYSKKQLVRRLEQSITKRTTIDASPEGLPIGRPRTAFRPCPKRARGVLPTRAPLFPTTDRKLPGLPPR